jgi:hypothetical protein
MPSATQGLKFDFQGKNVLRRQHMATKKKAAKKTAKKKK